MRKVVITIEQRNIATSCRSNRTTVVLSPAHITLRGYNTYALGVHTLIIAHNVECAVGAAILTHDNLHAEVGLLAQDTLYRCCDISLMVVGGHNHR